MHLQRFSTPVMNRPPYVVSVIRIMPRTARGRATILEWVSKHSGTPLL